MARPLRIQYPGAYYRIINRGLEYRNIFTDERDYGLFFNLLNQCNDKFKLVVHCYCLMANHYHLFIETPDANLSRIMRHLDGVYTQSFNYSLGDIIPRL